MKVKMIKSVTEFIMKNKTVLLTAGEVAGVAATGFFSFKAGMRAKEKLSESGEDISKKEKARLYLRSSVFPIALGTATAGLCIFQSYIDLKDIAAFAALYKISEKKKEDYIEASKRTVGEKKAEEIRQTSSKVAADRIANDGEIWEVTGKGEYPCIDLNTRRKFRSTIEEVRQAFININQRLIEEEFVPLNDLMYELNLPVLGKLGEDNGFPGLADGGKLLTTDNGSLIFDSVLVGSEGPVFTFDYKTYPAKWAGDFDY